MVPFAWDTEADPIHTGICGIRCAECGSPGPGRGCAGKGMDLLFSRIADVDADFRISDVLGDVVCGGFSIPARPSNADAIVIVTSGEMMSILAANNILHGLENVNPGPCVLGIVLNRRDVSDEEAIVERFAEATGLPILCDLPRSDRFAESESAGSLLVSMHPDCPEAEELRSLARHVETRPGGYVPRPVSDDSLADVIDGRPVTPSGGGSPVRVQAFDFYDRERNLMFSDGYVMPACTSHGAADAAMRVSDLAVILHGPRNCSYLTWFAYERRALYGGPERSVDTTPPGLYSTGLDADSAFRGSTEIVDVAVRQAKEDGYAHAVLIPTCASEIMGVDLARVASEMSSRHGIDVFAVASDRRFLSSKFGCLFGMYDAMIGRMGPRPVIEGTVNLVARTFYGVGKERNMRAVSHLLELMGLSVGHRLLDFCSMSDIEDFRSAEFDIQVGGSRINSRICDRIAEVTGRRRALKLDIPVGLRGCRLWVEALADYVPDRKGLAENAVRALEAEYEAGLAGPRRILEGRKVVVYSIMARDLLWQMEALEALGAEVVALLFVDGFVVDRNVKVPDYRGLDVRWNSGMGELEELLEGSEVDLVVTNDPDRVSRLGCRWAPLTSRYYGIDGAVEWARVLADSLRVPAGRWEEGL